jgi:hypothetical protein
LKNADCPMSRTWTIRSGLSLSSVVRAVLTTPVANPGGQILLRSGRGIHGKNSIFGLSGKTRERRPSARWWPFSFGWTLPRPAASRDPPGGAKTGGFVLNRVSSGQGSSRKIRGHKTQCHPRWKRIRQEPLLHSLLRGIQFLRWKSRGAVERDSPTAG